MRRAARALLASLWLLAGAAGAHEMSMAEMDVRESTPGSFVWQWTATSDRQGRGDEPTPIWPEACHADGNTLQCGAAGLRGTLTMEGVGQRYSAAIVKVHWNGGATSVYTLTGAKPSVQLYGGADDRRGMAEVAAAYLVLGVEHILTGYDHLAFVIGLLFLVGFRRRLLWVITAFTVAHSVTLASAALGWLTLRPAPVEACIALSIVLVASESLNPRPTLARRLPALVAFLFGLVHGLGFAGALKDIGLPQQHLAVALLSFNIGVECGQLATVAAAWALVRAVRGRAWAPRLRLPLLYGIGSVAAYWSWGRIAAVLA